MPMTKKGPAKIGSATARMTPSPGNAVVLQRACACGAHSGSRCGCDTKTAAPPEGAQEPNEQAFAEIQPIPGQPLDARTRRDMESGFRFDFSRVRVHTSPSAVESVR